MKPPLERRPVWCGAFSIARVKRILNWIQKRSPKIASIWKVISKFSKAFFDSLQSMKVLAWERNREGEKKERERKRESGISFICLDQILQIDFKFQLRNLQRRRESGRFQLPRRAQESTNYSGNSGNWPEIRIREFSVDYFKCIFKSIFQE